MKERCWYKSRGTVELELASFPWKQIADESECVKNKSDFTLTYCVENLE